METNTATAEVTPTMKDLEKFATVELQYSGEKWKQSTGRARVYLYDLKTRKQIAHPAMFDLSRFGYATINGRYDKESVQGFEVVDCSTRKIYKVTPKAGVELAVKFWHPALSPEWCRFKSGDGSKLISDR